MNFKPVLRFAVMSDVHYSESFPNHRRNFKRAMELVYSYADAEAYNSLDALYVVGDFTDRGKREEMQWFANDCRECIRNNTLLVITMANHELHYMPDFNVALKDFDEIFKMPRDRHEIICGYHFISLSAIRDKGPWSDSFNDEKKAFLKAELEKARADTGNKPIFVFQHAGIPETIVGGVGGHTELYAILSDYPQVIDFSGHSHNSVRDPREINQKNFTTVGTGSMSSITSSASWFDFHITGDRSLGHGRAQMLVVEADSKGTVRLRGLDVTDGGFFEDRFITDCHDKSAHTYTLQRALTEKPPYFEKDSKVRLQKEEGKIIITFPAAKSDGERVKEYCIRLTDENGVVMAQKNIFSDYMHLVQSDTVTTEINWEYPYFPRALVYASGFWENTSEPIS